MNDLKLERRDFFTIIGVSMASAFLCLTPGCDSKKEESEEISDTWIKTGRKEIKEAYTHLIWVYEKKEDICKESFGEVNVPDGYAYVGSEAVFSDNLQASKQIGVKYNFVNLVDVEADEYINKKTEEFGFPMAGVPMDLSKTNDLPKVLSKTL